MDDTQAKKVIRETSAAYNIIAGLFSSTRDYVWNDVKPLLATVVPNTTTLDIGCGNGRLYQELAKNQVNYIGIDNADKLIDVAKEKYPAARFIASDMTKIPLQEGVADMIFSIASFHHLPTDDLRVRALREMKRLLKPEGRIVMLNWNLYSNWARSKGFSGDENGDFYIPWKDAKKQVLATRYYHGFMLEDLHDLAEQAGLMIERQYYSKDGKESSLGPGDNIVTVMRP
ncbi:MAG: hypothetical protein COU35_00220 [Candidatus Magasanikbacteria bacterium CG10_big_fil_rev_8_21_14_0_10_47_10]|uniref:Methyltransferase type 11 domain-containing protein n=1 Tax=Candidatus Magasanikbacteria bacterium CG10_big_fil_rev_8_21_14_0_10_47_10 TaxID=1974652 RepID=A0A2H0TRU4_9BACT|nr:MAG: hypothetical protein COU35_00220 [Candidatus Magasanikbacteria bacterium CG10_big_fil_rev_8_21_14_0_10_47_10]